MQRKQFEWKWQWSKIYDNNSWLFTDWIYPNKLEDFRNKEVLDCGCGCGQHLNIIAPFAKRVTGIDLNTFEIAKKNKKYRNIEIIDGDIATIKLKKKFDIVYSIGVLHHTDDIIKSFNNIKSFLKNDGKLIIWVYSYEGNFLNRIFLEFFKKHFFLKFNKKLLWIISNLITFLMYIPIYSVYLLPLENLPYYQYFQNWRKLSFRRNMLNIFDKLNAPQTFFIKKETIEKLFNKKEFTNIHISIYKDVSWRASGTLK